MSVVAQLFLTKSWAKAGEERGEAGRENMIDIPVSSMEHQKQHEQDKKEMWEMLIHQMLPYIRYVASQVVQKTKNALITMDDCVSEGVTGIGRALRTFKPQNGENLEVFVKKHIRGQILEAVRATMPYSRPIGTLVKMMEEEDDRLSVETLCAKYRCCRSTAIAITRIQQCFTTVSLNAIDKEEGNGREKDPAVIAEEADMIHTALSVCSDRQREVLLQRYFHYRTISDIGQAMGLSQEIVMYIHNEAIAKIQRALNVPIYRWNKRKSKKRGTDVSAPRI